MVAAPPQLALCHSTLLFRAISILFPLPNRIVRIAPASAHVMAFRNSL
jgi:hypothetical protein